MRGWRGRRVLVCAFVVAACVATAAALADGAVKRALGLSVQETVVRGMAPPVKRAGLDSRLGEVGQILAARGQAAALATARARGLDVEQSRVRVVIEARAGKRADAAAGVRAAGGEVEAQYAGLVQALVPLVALERLADHAAVRLVRPPFLSQADGVAGEEVSASYANAFQGYGWTGSGAKVAIVDLGFAGYADRQAGGDLPAALTTIDLCGGGFTSGTSHGTAVAEIVHEMAPAAQLYLICINTEVTLGQAEEYVKANGIKIVNHSVGWFDTSRGDGTGATGTPDAIVADARANGILWANSAGNHAQRHWSGTFTDADADDWHEFSGGDLGNTLFLPAGASTCATLKWDDWPASANDYDLYLARSSDALILAGSANLQTGSQAPTEDFCYQNTTGVSQNFFLAINRYNAGQTPRFDLFSTATPLEYQVAAGSVTEPASSPNAMAVGALCWQSGGLQPYSSIGPTIDNRIKPDISGLDAVSSATYGAAAGCDGGFTGTSAASPHAAGAAALLASENPALTGPQLETVLEARAVDLGPPGRDNLTGVGSLYVSTFTDVPPWLGLANYVEQLFHKGVTTGCTALNPTTGERHYCPDDSVTRRDMAVFIVRAKPLVPLTPATPTFSDVPASTFGFGHVERMYEQAITSGCFFDAGTGERRYCPLDFVTRRDMAVFIVRAANLGPLTPSSPTFSDVPASMFGFGHVERMYERGITTGCSFDAGTGERRYCPLDLVSRRAMAAFLIRAFGP